jgi:hypothetical protein
VTQQRAVTVVTLARLMPAAEANSGAGDGTGGPAARSARAAGERPSSRSAADDRAIRDAYDLGFETESGRKDGGRLLDGAPYFVRYSSRDD